MPYFLRSLGGTVCFRSGLARATGGLRTLIDRPEHGTVHSVQVQDDPTHQRPPRAAGGARDQSPTTPAPAAGGLRAGDTELWFGGFLGLSGEPGMLREKDERKSKPRAGGGLGSGAPKDSTVGEAGRWHMGWGSPERQVNQGATGAEGRDREPGWSGSRLLQACGDEGWSTLPRWRHSGSWHMLGESERIEISA